MITSNAPKPPSKRRRRAAGIVDELGEHRVERVVAFRWICREPAREHAPEMRGDFGEHRTARDRGAQVAERLALERPRTGERLECDDAERILIRRRRRRTAREELGRHVDRRADHLPRDREVDDRRRDRQVGSSASARARPKSVTSARPSLAISTLSGLKSRWTMPAACAAASPSACIGEHRDDHLPALSAEP